MERCPICRGRLDAEAQCQRCGAELALAVKARNEAKNLTSQAIKLMTDGEFIQAEHLIEQTLALEHSQFKQQLLEFVRQCITNDSPAHHSEIARSHLLVDSTEKIPLLKRISKSFRAHS